MIESKWGNKMSDRELLEEEFAKHRADICTQMYSEGGNKAEERFGIASFGAHELLHLASVVQDLWERQVLHHPSTSLSKDLFETAWKINEMIADFYQGVGQEFGGS